MPASSRTQRIAAHPGFSLSLATRRQIQSTTCQLRQALRSHTPISARMSCELLRQGLQSVESVLTTHSGAQPEDSGAAARRLVRLAPPLIGAFAQLRYCLSYALSRGDMDNEPEMDWLQHRAYAHSDRAVELLGAVLRAHRAVRAGEAVGCVGLPS